MIACPNNNIKARMGNKRSEELPAGPNNFKNPLKRKPSLSFTTGTWGCKKTGSLINNPKTSKTKILAGVFCLKIPITDEASY